MNLFPQYAGTKFFSGVNTPTPIAPLSFNQNDNRPLAILFLDDAAAAVAMTNWTIEAAIVAGAGKPTGDPGGPALAAYTAAADFTYDAPTKTFNGRIDCNTVDMATLIASGAIKTSTFAIKATNGVTGDVFELQIACNVQAAVIESPATGPAAAPVAWTKDQADNRFVKRIGLPGETQLFVSPDSTKAREIGCANDGSFINNLIDPWVAP